MKYVIAWELKRRRTSILWWSIGSIVLTGVILALFPSIRDQAPQMNEVLNQMPKELRGLKSGGSADINVGDPVDFLNSQLFYATLPILWIILAITRGAGIMGREEQDRTLELLLARPVSRSKLLLAKAVALLLELVIVGAVTLTTIVLLAPIFDIDLAFATLSAATAYTALFSLSFGYIAFALQAASKLTKRGATAFAVLLGFGGYVLASLSSLTDWLEVPVKFAPYHYFTPLDALQGKTPKGLVAYLIGVFVIGTIVAFLGFRHRDIE